MVGYTRLREFIKMIQVAVMDMLLPIIASPYELFIAIFLKLVPLLERALIFRYSDFRKEPLSKRWEKSLAHLKFTPLENINLECKEKENYPLKIITKKKPTNLSYPFEWEGGQIIAKDKGFNFLRAKMRLNFEESTAEEGNVAIWALGNTGNFRYLMGIDKRSKDIFAHCMDDRGNEYIKERARTHFKDYLKGKSDEWVVLGIKWELNGVKFFVYDELTKEYDEYLFRGPLTDRELRERILKDAAKTFLCGIKELWIRTDLVARDVERSIIAEIEYVDAIKAPFYWLCNRSSRRCPS